MEKSQNNVGESVENNLKPAPPPGDDEELRRLVKCVDQSIEASADYRKRAERDRDFYDGVQWTSEEIEEMNRRGQPVPVFNHIFPKINYILGTEIATRVDPETKPRTKSHESESEVWTDMLRYYASHVRFDVARSAVLENMAIEGLGGFIFAPVVRKNAEGVPEVDFTLTHVEWDRIFVDPLSKRRDYADARYLGIMVWMDLDDAISHPLYKNKAEELKDAVNNAKPSDDTYEDNPQMWSARDPERVRVVQMFYKRGRRWVEAHFCGSAFLVAPRWVTLRDDNGDSWCPLMLGSPFRMRRKSDSMAEPYGVVRNMTSPQEMINKGRSKAMHLMNMRQVWAEDGAFTGDCSQPEYVLTEVSKPDGYLSVAPGSLRDGRVKVDSNLELAASQVQMMQEAKAEVDAVGPSAPVVSGDQRVRSGRAEQQRAESSSRELAPLFEQLRDLQMRAYRALAWLIRQFCPEERWLSVSDEKERTGYRFVALNRRMARKERLAELLRKQVPLVEAVHSVGIQPVVADELIAQATAAAQQQTQAQALAMQQAGQQVAPEALQSMMNQGIMQLLASAPVMQETLIYNDVGRMDLDIVLTTTPETAVVQQEEFDKIMEVVGTGMVKFPPEVIVEMSQLRNKRTLRDMVKAPPPDPIQQEIQKIQIAMMQAEVEKKKAETVDTLAHAEQRKADAAFKTGPQAMKTQAQAMDAAASAGGKTA